MDGWIHGKIDGQIHGWMTEWMDRQNDLLAALQNCCDDTSMCSHMIMDFSVLYAVFVNVKSKAISPSFNA